MRFAFSDEQILFQRAVRELLLRECPPAEVRRAWTSETGRSTTRWQRLGEVGLLGSADALDWILPLEEAGWAALPEPLVETLAAAPLVAATHRELVERVTAGKAMLTLALDGDLVPDAHVAELVLLRAPVTDELHALPPSALQLERVISVDGARRLYRVRFTPSPSSRVAADRAALDGARDRAALATAAMLLGLGRRMLELTVEHAKTRKQFNQPIGAFQAVKHQLADVHVALEMARPLVHQAAYASARNAPDRATATAMAKAAASDAAESAARAALQCHGAIGYSFEHDLHLWMKRAWCLSRTWGDAAFHRARVAATLLGG